MYKKITTLMIISILSLNLAFVNVNAQEGSEIINYLNNRIHEYKILPTIQQYPTQPGDILITSDPYKGLIPTGHVAIVLNEDEIVEATSNGVIISRNDWIQTKKEVYGIRIDSVKNTDQFVEKISDYLNNNLTKKYNYNYLNTKRRDKYYCSHLAYSLYLDLFDINLDTPLFGKANNGASAIHPLELVLSKYANIIYYQPFNKDVVDY